MAQRIFIALGAGLAAALLFIIPMKGTVLAMIIAVLSTLPIMIAGLGFGQATAFGATLAGAIGISLYLHPIFGGVFALSLGLPAWWLSRMAVMCRPASEGSTDLVWYPVERLLGWVVTLSAATTLMLIGMAIIRIGSYDEFVSLLTQRLSPALEAMFSNFPGYTSDEVARLVIASMPPVMAGWGVVTLALNLWLAGRIVLISQLLTRPWESLPENLRLPAIARPVLAGALAACLIEGPVRLIGMTVAASIMVAYAFQGLAATHSITRGSAARLPILMGVYFSILVLLPWPLIIAAIAGLIDTVWPLRQTSASNRNPPTNPTT